MPPSTSLDGREHTSDIVGFTTSLSLHRLSLRSCSVRQRRSSLSPTHSAAAGRMASHAAAPVLLCVSLFLLLSLAAAQPPPTTMADVRITSITGCVDVYPVTVNCSVATNTLRIQTAAGFPTSTDVYAGRLWVYVDLNGYSYFTTTSVWPDLSDPTNTSVFVNVTAGAYYPHITGVLVNVSFIDRSAYPSPTSPAFAGFSYRFEGPPTLTSIAGCEGSGQATRKCVPDSAVVELTGSGLLWYASGNRVSLTIGNSSATGYIGLQVGNDTYATMSLQRIFSQLLKPQHYAGVLLPLSLSSYGYHGYTQRENSYTTNSLFISFVPLPPPVIQLWYDHTTAAVCLASVL